MSRYLWVGLLATLSTAPALASTIQIQPDPTETSFEFTTDSKGILLTKDSTTNYSVSLAKLDTNANDPPREPVEGWFELKTEGDGFNIKVGFPYNVLRSEDTLAIAVLAQKIEGTDFEADTFLRSVGTADLSNPSTLVRYFWFAKQIWEARKALLDHNQHDIDVFDVGVGYYYVVLAREALTSLTVTPPSSSLEAANWLKKLAGVRSPSKTLFNDQSAPASTALIAVQSLTSIAKVQDARVGKILGAIDRDFSQGGRVYDAVFCGHINETLDMIDGFSPDQWGKKMDSYRTLILAYSSGCLASEANKIREGQQDRLQALTEQSQPIVDALQGLQPTTRDIRSRIQVLKDALANAAKRI